MAANVTLTGDLTRRMRRGEKRVAKAVEQTGKGIVKGAKQRVPVDTGHLRSSIESQPLDDGRALVTVHAHYAHFVEYGTRRMAAQPYLVPAAEAERQLFVRRISRAYEA